MSECTQDRADMLGHASAIAVYIARKTVLTEKQAYEILMGCVNSMEEYCQPKEVERCSTPNVRTVPLRKEG